MYAIIRICFACTLFTVALAIIPPYIKVCSRNDPNINVCVANSIEQLRHKLTTGIPELKVPAMDPLTIKRLTMHLLRGPKNAKLDFVLSNVQVYGPSAFKIRDLKIDLKNSTNVIINCKIGFPKLEIRGKYQIDTQILLIRLFGEGNGEGTVLGFESDLFMKANKIFKNNDTYIIYEKITLNNIKINKIHLNLDNLFNGDPVLGTVANEILNANNFLVEAITPELENSLSEFVTNIANRITENMIYDEMFPLK